MIVVVDTNVLVSGLLKASGNPVEVVNHLLAGKIKAAYDIRIMREYREVLKRPKFNFQAAEIEALINFLEIEGMLVYPQVLKVKLPDPDDLPFLEVAAAIKSRILVTGNSRDYPETELQGVRILNPAAMVELLNKTITQKDHWLHDEHT